MSTGAAVACESVNCKINSLSTLCPSNGVAVDSPPPQLRLTTRRNKIINRRRESSAYRRVRSRTLSGRRPLPQSTASRPMSPSRARIEEGSIRRHVGERNTANHPSASVEVKRALRTEVQLEDAGISMESPGKSLRRYIVLANVQVTNA